MDIESVRLYCLKKKGVSESFPFDADTLVFKVMGKIFVLLPLENGDRINLKCDPEYAIELRERYPEAIMPGYHMNKKHWNTVMLNLHLSVQLIRDLIDHSYDMVVKGLKKKDQLAIEEMD